MILYCVKCLMVTKNRSIKAKYEIDAKINFYSRCTDFSFKNFETTDEEKLSYILEGLI